MNTTTVVKLQMLMTVPVLLQCKIDEDGISVNRALVERQDIDVAPGLTLEQQLAVYRAAFVNPGTILAENTGP